MREKLIELLDEAENFAKEKCAEYEVCVGCPYSCKDANYCMDGFIVNHLLANGVIILPCKVGDTVYDISEFIEGTAHPEIYELKDQEIAFMANGWFSYDSTFIQHEDFGNTLFLTREEAEAALKEVQG